MYRYAGESARKSAQLSTTEQIAQTIHSTLATVKAQLYPAKKPRDLTLSFDEQLARYGEVEKPLFF